MAISAKNVHLFTYCINKCVLGVYYTILLYIMASLPISRIPVISNSAIRQRRTFLSIFIVENLHFVGITGHNYKLLNMFLALPIRTYLHIGPIS